MQDANQNTSSSQSVSKLRTFAREHPGLTAVGLGCIGLVAGPELAGGILIGAGVTALLRRERHREAAHEHHTLREKSRAFAQHVPHVVRDRARAVVDAARGKRTQAQEPDYEPLRKPEPEDWPTL